MLHEQNQLDLEKLCGKKGVPEYIQRYFEEAAELYEKFNGAQFRVQAMVTLYMQALRLDPAKETKRLAAKDAEAAGKKAGGKAAKGPAFEVNEDVLVDLDGTDHRGKFAGLIKGDPDNVLIRYQDGEPPVKTVLSLVRARK